MFHLHNLPSHGHVFGFVTATRVEWADDDYTETHGWVNDIGDFELEDNRNYVHPLVSADVNDEDLPELIADVLSNLFPYEDNQDGTLYGQHEYNESGEVSYTYAVHFVVKHRNPKTTSVHDSYIETPLHVR